jgi:HSP20 family protein
MGDGKTKIFNWSDMPKEAQHFLGEDFWGEINRLIPRHGPSIDMYKTESEVVVVAEVPGIDSADKISIKIKGLKLIITGEIPMTYPVPQEEILQKERFIGSFTREITLPSDVDVSKSFGAQFRLGLIELRMPRLSKADEKEINIDFGQKAESE